MVEEGIVGYGGVECPVLFGGERGPPVLLLHGFSFRGRTWLEAGVLEALEREGYRFAAPDMPYGRSTGCTTRSRDIDLNVGMAREVVSRFLGGELPVVVGASLGGRISLYYAVAHGARGLFLVAPAVRDDDAVLRARRTLREIPSMLLWGTRDRVVGRRLMEWLSELLNARLVVYEGAGHALYLDEPDRFVGDLLSFLASI